MIVLSWTWAEETKRQPNQERVCMLVYWKQALDAGPHAMSQFLRFMES
jgi:hypothetical protein